MAHTCGRGETADRGGREEEKEEEEEDSQEVMWILVLMLNYDCYTPNAFWLVYTAQFGFAFNGN